ncbi:MAG: Membrane protein insertase YidC [Syntrophus sp. SKADARSKE-3]|nr:Membrane protein insertase YidC [Syntrophus sp. SKADARSKE-3]
MDKRTFLAIVLSLAVIVTYHLFFSKPPVKQPLTEQKTTEQKTMAAATADSKAQAISPPVAGQANAPQIAQQAAAPVVAPEKFVTVDTPFYTAVFTTNGGALKSFRLKGYRKTIDKNSDLIEMINVQPDMPAPLSVSFPGSSIDVPVGSAFEANVQALDLTKGSDTKQLTFTQTFPGRVRIEKIYTFYPGKYAFDLEVRMYNLTAEPIGESSGLSWYAYVDPAVETDSYTHEGPVAFVKKDVERPEVKKMEAETSMGPGVTWGGFESKYFISAMIPQNPSLTSIVMAKNATSHLVSVSLRGAKNIIPAGQAGIFSYTLFLGPKDHSILKAQGAHLEDAIDFGSWLKWLAMPMLFVLKFFNQYINNYGLSIILLTVLIKIIFWPLGNKSYESMKEMQKLQPKMQEMREKYKDDKQRLSQETMALYKAHKVNPLGGCLPMVIQIPVFFGLYKTLLYAIELRHSPLFWWIQDLSAPDTLFGHVYGFAVGPLPILMGATMFIQQKMTPMGGDPMQAKIMLWMPVIFTVMFLNFPSGLVIYWLFNNIISIGQQYYINKRHA